MRAMKKLICLAAALAILLAGCGALTETTAETTIETEPKAQAGEGPKEMTPPLDYEVIYGFAKTPTHYYAAHDGGIVYAPIDNLAKQTKIPLPGNHEGMKLAGAEICGITKDYLFVNIWEARGKIRHEYDGGYYEEEDYENRVCATFRIAIGSWEAVALITDRYNSQRPLPWYNAASDSLLIPLIPLEIADVVRLEAMQLGTRKRALVLLDGEALSFGLWSSWWQNAQEGQAVLQECRSDDGRRDNYYVFDKHNQVQQKRYDEIRLVEYWDWKREVSPKNKAEEALNSKGIGRYITCGAYVYYVQSGQDGTKDDFYRVKIDNTEHKLLRGNTNIIQLKSAGDKLFCQAYNPTKTRQSSEDSEVSRQIDIYLLDEDGKHAKTLFHYWDNTEGNSGYGLMSYGDKLMVTHSVIYAPERFAFLYDPATAAKFPAQND